MLNKKYLRDYKENEGKFSLFIKDKARDRKRLDDLKSSGKVEIIMICSLSLLFASLLSVQCKSNAGELLIFCWEGFAI
jgi:hypothetical protein